MPDNDDEPATSDDLRRFEAQTDDRFRAVSTRFDAVDGRFADLAQQLDTIEQRLQVIASFETRFPSIDHQLDANRSYLDQAGHLLTSELTDARRHIVRLLVLGAIGSLAATAVLCAGTIALLL